MNPSAPTHPPSPPAWAGRLMLRRLGGSDLARSVLGDLNEDFVALQGRRGRFVAAFWFCLQALWLSLTLRSTMPNSTAAQTQHRSTMNLVSSFSELVQDGRYALRAVRRDFSLFVFSVVIVGIGIGACTAVFSVLSPLLIKSLPFEQPERLVWVANEGEGSMSGVTSRSSNLRDFREASRAFDGLTGFFAFFEQGSYNLGGTDRPQRLVGVGVAQNFLEVLGIHPQVGRNFNEQEGQWGGPPAIILSHGFWTRQYAADPDIVGKTLLLDNEPNEVIGVLPETFDFAQVFAPRARVDFLSPFPISDETDRWGNSLSMIGRLAPGVSVAQAQSDLDQVIAGLQEAQPDRWGLGAVVTGMQEQIAGPFRSALLLLALAAGAVMMIVCVNLSNLLLAKSSRRRQEMAVRSAMGASRFRLVRQMLLESSLLSIAGAGLGVLVAGGATRFIAGLEGLSIPMLTSMQVDGRALLFSTFLAILVGFLVGLVPALQISSGREAGVIRDGSRGMTASRDNTRFRELLVVGEVALACTLLVVGGLMLRSFQNVLNVDLGFSPEEATAWQLSSDRPFETVAELAAYYDQIRSAVSAVPGVSSVGLSDAIPLGPNRTWGLNAPGYTYEDDADSFSSFPHFIDPEYLNTLNIPLVSGRMFNSQDDHEAELVTLLNETAARRVMNGEDPVGRKVRIGGSERLVVGVVADIRHRSLEDGAGAQMYMPLAQEVSYSSLDLVVRSSLDPEVLAQGVAGAIHDVDPHLPAQEYRTLNAVVDRSISPRKFTLQLLATFAGVALLLAALGIYGVLSYSVAERVPEISIRMALGESAGEVLRRVVGQTLRLAVIGLAVGVVASILVSRWVSSMLYGVEAADPWNFLAMASVLLVVAGLSGLIPAIRASRTNISTVLRAG